jgi:osmotically-inducible protein OsmY
LAVRATPAGAGSQAAPAMGQLDQIVVTAKKHPTPVPDEVLTTTVETALHSDTFFFSEHVTVTIKNGVATLHGQVFDDWDLRQAIRISRKVAGVRRVVNDLEIVMTGD